MARVTVNPREVLRETGEQAGIEVKPLTGEQKAGLYLSYFLLSIISVILLFLFWFLIFEDFDASDEVYKILLQPCDKEEFAKRIEQAHRIALEKKEYREYIMKNFQYVFGILLPVLTSILGYIFGTKSKAA